MQAKILKIVKIWAILIIKGAKIYNNSIKIHKIHNSRTIDQALIR